MIDAKASEVYDLLRDSSRVEEYNDECQDIQELQVTLIGSRPESWVVKPTVLPAVGRRCLGGFL